MAVFRLEAEHLLREVAWHLVEACHLVVAIPVVEADFQVVHQRITCAQINVSQVHLLTPAECSVLHARFLWEAHQLALPKAVVFHAKRV